MLQQEVIGRWDYRTGVEMQLRHAAESPTCGVDSPLGNLLRVLEELGLGSARVPEQQHVDVSTQAMAATGMLLLATKEGQGNAALDVEMAVDGGCDGIEDEGSCAAHCIRQNWHHWHT